MTDFKIKYLFELFPDTDFTEEWVLCQDVNELPPDNDIIETPEIWGDVRVSLDGSGNPIPTTKRNRKIQSKSLRKYEVKLVLARDIDWSIVDYAEYTTCTTDTSGVEETFLIYNVDIQQTKVQQSLEYIITITFLREEDKIVYHTASDNVLSYKTDESETVNEIQCKVHRPPMSFNCHNWSSSTYYEFFIEDDNDNFDLVDSITSLNQYFYLHCANWDFKQNDIYECYVQAKTTSKITFRTNTATPAITDLPINLNVILDFEPDFQESVNVDTTNTFSFNIYTFIEPEFKHISEPEEGSETNYSIQENQTTKEYDLAEFKVWLKFSEKWKAEYLSYCLVESDDADFSPDVLISLKNYDNILPDQIKDIITPVENRRLIDLFEYDIKVIYNIKEVNLNR
jgi:hypothetical protein